MSFEDPIDASVDYWALGVTIINLLTGREPWNGKLVNQVTADYKLPPSISPAACHFIAQCLAVSMHPNPQQHFCLQEMIMHNNSNTNIFFCNGFMCISVLIFCGSWVNQVDPSERMSSQKNPLSHPWFDMIDVQGLKNRAADSPISPLMTDTEGCPTRFTDAATTTTSPSFNTTASNYPQWNLKIWEPVCENSNNNGNRSTGGAH